MSTIIVVLALWCVGVWYLPLPMRHAGEPRQRNERGDLLRYEGLRPLLGDAREVWMYVDPGPHPHRFARRSRGQDFRAQFALAPVVVRQVLRPRDAIRQAQLVEDYRLIVFFRTRATLESIEDGLQRVAVEYGGTVSLDFVDNEVALLGYRRMP